MWDRKDLKAKGKTSFKANYWKSVLVALVLTVAMVGGTSAAWSGGHGGSVATNDNVAVNSEDGSTVAIDNNGLVIETPEGDSVTLDDDGAHVTVKGDASKAEPAISIDAKDGDDSSSLSINVDASDIVEAITPGMLAMISLTLLVVFALTIVIYAFIYNPLQAGCRGFFLANLNRPAEVREAVGTFDHGYQNVVKAMILRDVFTFLWTLLFIIPGIVKSYEYRMIPYLVADNPNLTYKEAFAESRRMMQGNKWRTFVLDLSFIGWWILSAFTFGLLAVFYVSPYHAATSAALYEELRYGSALPSFAAPVAPEPHIPAHAAPVPPTTPVV